MGNQRIGNWEISPDGITWVGELGGHYFIDRGGLTESGPGDRSKMYDWLVHMVEKTWLKPIDIYALNTALILAIEQTGRGFPKGMSFADTFAEQQRLLAGRDQT